MNKPWRAHRLSSVFAGETVFSQWLSLLIAPLLASPAPQGTPGVTKFELYYDGWWGSSLADSLAYGWISVAEFYSLMPPVRVGTMLIVDNGSSTKILFEAVPDQVLRSQDGYVDFDGNFIDGSGRKSGGGRGHIGRELRSRNDRFEAEIKRDPDGKTKEIAFRSVWAGNAEHYFHAKRFSDDEPIQGYDVSAVEHGLKALKIHRFDVVATDRIYLSAVDAAFDDLDLRLPGGTCLLLDYGGDEGYGRHLTQAVRQLVGTGERTWPRPAWPLGIQTFFGELRGKVAGMEVHKLFSITPRAEPWPDLKFFRLTAPNGDGRSSALEARLFLSSNGDADHLNVVVSPFVGGAVSDFGAGWIQYRISAPNSDETSAALARKIDVPLTDLRTMIGWIIARRMILPIR